MRAGRARGGRGARSGRGAWLSFRIGVWREQCWWAQSPSLGKRAHREHPCAAAPPPGPPAHAPCARRLTGFGIHHCFARSMMGHEVKVPLLEDFYADYYTAAGIALASCLAMCLAVRVLGRRGGLLLFMILTALASLLQLGLLNREWAGPGAVGRPGAPLSSLNPCIERPPDELPLERAATAPGVWGLFSSPDSEPPHCPRGVGSLLP